MRLDRRGLLVAVTGLMMAGHGASAVLARRSGRDGDDDDDDDHSAAAKARAAGEILPLTEILEHVKLTQPGEIVGIELDRKKGQWVYEIKVIAPGGRFLEIYLDARDKSILKIQGK